MCKTYGGKFNCDCVGDCICRIELHCHSDYSNLRLLDSINSIEGLLQTASDLKLRGLALTEHETIASHVRIIQAVRKLKEQGRLDKNFKLILGNEIYLVDNLEEVRDNYQSGKTKFPHYLLLAKDSAGHEALRILSSQAWENSFYTGTMERVPTTKDHLERIVKQFPNKLIATSSCLGSESSILILESAKAKSEGNTLKQEQLEQKLHKFIEWNIGLHGKENFFLELQPSSDYEQSTVNKKLIELSKAHGLKLIITNDVHYLRPEDKDVHSAYLKSKQDERETEAFYSHTYLHKNEEIYEKMSYIDKDVIREAIANTMLIGSMIEDYTIESETIIPVAKLPEFEVKHIFKKGYKDYPYIEKMANSDNEQDRYLIYLIENGFKEKIPYKTMNKEEFHRYIARINIELEELWEMSIILNQSMSSYYVTVAKIIELIWGDDCGDVSKAEGSIVGAGRGSAVAFLTNYLLSVSQVNPLAYGIEVPHWRHLHKSKPDISALDIDIDITSTRKGFVFDRMREFFGEKQVIQVCTFGTEGTKSAIQTSCRGLGIVHDTALFLSSLVPMDRGEVWSLNDCLYGNEEKDRQPIKQLIDELEKYPRLRETALRIEGLVNKRSIHAGGVLVLNEEYTKMNAMMKAPNGTPITQFNLDDSQACGSIKFDILVIEGNDKIQECINLLLRYGEIEWQGTLRKTFNKYFHPEIIDKENPELFKLISEDKILDLFQFSTPLGQQVIQKAKPKNLIELVSLNSLMRLMSDSTEQPIDTFIRYKNDISLWYEEMKDYGLTEKEVAIFEKYLKVLNGVADTQEAVMLMAMDEGISGFTVKEANYLRKSISKKKAEIQEEVKEKLYSWGKERGTRDEVLDYLWLQISRMLGYAFSIPHVLAYTLIALVEANLSYYYNPLYWQTACLTVNSGSLEVDEDTKQKTTNYGKVAEAIGKMKVRGVNIAQPLINQAEFGFVPDTKNDRIIFSLKGLVGIGDDAANAIVHNRPYDSFEHFLSKLYDTSILKNKHVIQLIKAGAFTEFEDRVGTMKKFISRLHEPKTSLNMQNFNSLMELNLIPEEYEHIKRLFNFRKYLMKNNVIVTDDPKNKKYKISDNYTLEFYNKYFSDIDAEYEDTYPIFTEKVFKKAYDKLINEFKPWLATDESVILYNQRTWQELWDKHAQGTVSKWEMDSLSFYYTEHELAHVDNEKYGFTNFFNLPEEAEIESYMQFRNGTERPKYKLHTIAGTVLDKDKNKHTVTLLTTDGVVVVKYYDGAFAHYNKTISQVDDSGTKKTLEGSWFTRGNKLIVQGYRRGSQFKPQKYKDSHYSHTTYLITNVFEDGTIEALDERYQI